MRRTVVELPFRATYEDFERCKQIISSFSIYQTNLNEITLTIMIISYSTGGDYSKESILEYAKAYLNK